MGILAPKDLRQWPSEREYIPLLRSLADRAARVAINMALLTELFAAPAAPLRHVTDAYKEQSLASASRSAMHRPIERSSCQEAHPPRRWAASRRWSDDGPLAARKARMRSSCRSISASSSIWWS